MIQYNFLSIKTNFKIILIRNIRIKIVVGYNKFKYKFKLLFYNNNKNFNNF